MAQRTRTTACGPGGTYVIGSFLDTPELAVIALHGDVDAAAVDRLGVHAAPPPAGAMAGSTTGPEPVS